jgi:hypothetical protein
MNKMESWSFLCQYLFSLRVFLSDLLVMLCSGLKLLHPYVHVSVRIFLRNFQENKDVSSRDLQLTFKAQ